MNHDKLVCTDLDGTLLNEKGEVSDKNRKALKICLDKNMLVYLVSGRPYYYIKDIANSIDKRIKVIAFNGAYFKNSNKKVIKIFKEKDILYIKEIIKSHNLPAFFKTEYKIYTNTDISIFDYKDLGVFPIKTFKKIENQIILKVVIIEKNVSHKRFKEIVQELSKRFNISYYKNKGFEMSIKEASKGLAIESIIKKNNINKNNVFVFGDGMNDVSMFEVADNKIAPKNAEQYIKELSSFVSTDCNNSSVAVGLEHYGLIEIKDYHNDKEVKKS